MRRIRRDERAPWPTQTKERHGRHAIPKRESKCGKGAMGDDTLGQVVVHLSYRPAVQALDVQSLLSAAHLLASSRFFFQHLDQVPSPAHRPHLASLSGGGGGVRKGVGCAGA